MGGTDIKIESYHTVRRMLRIVGLETSTGLEVAPPRRTRARVFVWDASSCFQLSLLSRLGVVGDTSDTVFGSRRGSRDIAWSSTGSLVHRGLTDT
jgi:hypothetical protein